MADVNGVRAPSRDVVLDVKNLRKFYPIQRGFLRRTIGTSARSTT